MYLGISGKKDIDTRSLRMRELIQNTCMEIKQNKDWTVKFEDTVLCLSTSQSLRNRERVGTSKIHLFDRKEFGILVANLV